VPSGRLEPFAVQLANALPYKVRVRSSSLPLRFLVGLPDLAWLRGIWPLRAWGLGGPRREDRHARRQRTLDTVWDRGSVPAVHEPRIGASAGIASRIRSLICVPSPGTWDRHCTGPQAASSSERLHRADASTHRQLRATVRRDHQRRSLEARLSSFVFWAT
jgi:hypothetical protein